MSREDHRRYDAALLKLRAETAEKGKSAFRLPLEGLIGLLLEIGVTILGHLHIGEPLIIWGLFLLGLGLISDWVIRSWAPSRPERRNIRQRRLVGMLPVTVVAIILAVLISKGLELEKLVHSIPSTTPQTANNGVTGLAVGGPGVTMNNVVIDAFGQTGVRNTAGQLNFKNGGIANNDIGLLNENPNAQISFDGTQISGNRIGIINRDPRITVKKKSSK